MGPVKMGAPHFVDFGKNMEHSPDGKAYLLGMGAEENDPQAALCQPELDFGRPGLSGPRHAEHRRTSTTSSNTSSSPGTTQQGKPVWTGDFCQDQAAVGLEQQHGRRDGDLRRAA